MTYFSSLRPRAAAFALTMLLAACASTPHSPPIALNLVALNDFHGHLEGDSFTYTGKADAAPRTIKAGGIDTIGAALQAWRRDDAELLVVGAGDLVGASPALSSMWADEPSIAAMNLLGLTASSVGNHEFDQGRKELLRKQRGGCDSTLADKACKLAPQFDGARFSYLAANVIDSATGQPLLPAYHIAQAHGVKIAFIGAVLKDTPSVVLASGIAGLSFIDEAAAINRVLPELKAQGVTVFVVLIHEGGHADQRFDQSDCNSLHGPIVAIVKQLDPAIRLVVSGHTHTGYLCKIDGRVVTQAQMGGHVLSRIRLDVDPLTHLVREVVASNVVMQPNAYPLDPAVSNYLASVRARSDAALMRPLARLGVDLVSRKANKDGESALGDLIADAQLAATRALGAQIALINTGGIRKDLETGSGRVATYGQAQIVLPFSNTLVLSSLTGAQIRGLLEQQWLKPADEEHSMLQVSGGLSYRWDESLPAGQRVLPGSVMLNGVALVDNLSYRIVANNFLSEGGDNFPMFKQARDVLNTNIVDLDALSAYLVAQERAGTPAGSATPAARVVRKP